ncbi:stem 28 kDa glycoprotein isoform X2 [Cucumis sativus]|uniref:stem 28 kDa glycoprotein isoform X2 n=1 Tax=Cucumis sativus TaxID=3659 RepID=UPI0012F4EC9D|nr:stem 28 kDa glycoprotein isoform X2 [Cucumis sativus]
MAKFLFIFLALLITASASDWNILSQRSKSGLKISLKNYCESWRLNVELHNIRFFRVVPEECVSYIGKDVILRAMALMLGFLISMIPSSLRCLITRKINMEWNYDRGKKLNLTDLEAWMSKARAPILEHTLRLFNFLKAKGVDIILISARREGLRSATIENLVQVGYHGWTNLILRSPEDEKKGVEQYKADVRRRLVNGGYHIWGIVGDQYSSIQGSPSGRRTFKLPNPMYYVY